MSKKREDILTILAGDMEADRSIDDEIHIHTLKKLMCLKKYLYAYSAIVPKYFKDRYYIDTNAGSGINALEEPYDEVVYGSPLIALKYGDFTHYILIEKSQKKANKLRERVRSLTKDSKTTVDIKGGEDSNKLCGKILQEIPPFAHRFVFIDPSGLEIKWETVKKLSEMERAEIFQNFPLSGISRNVYRFYKKEGTCSVDECLGTTNWRKWVKRNRMGVLSRQEVREKIMKERVDQMESCKYRHIPCMPVRTRTNLLLYSMIFATKNDNAAKIMKDVMDIVKPWDKEVTADIALGITKPLKYFTEPHQTHLNNFV